MSVQNEKIDISINPDITTISKKDICIITNDKLDLTAISNEVADPSCGAISTFVGVTRNHFEGKRVLKLEYEAYQTMAEKELHKICNQVRSKWDVTHIAMYHKTGLVPIGDASVIIAISSVHREDGLEAVRYAIDELKATVPIWKKEFYSDGSVWKGNAECRHTHKHSHTPHDHPSHTSHGQISHAPHDHPPHTSHGHTSHTPQDHPSHTSHGHPSHTSHGHTSHAPNGSSPVSHDPSSHDPGNLDHVG